MPQVAIDAAIGAELARLTIRFGHHVTGGEHGGVMGFVTHLASPATAGPAEFALILETIQIARTDFAFFQVNPVFKPSFRDFDLHNKTFCRTHHFRTCAPAFQPDSFAAA
jgi:hypothetical protein